MQDGWYYRSLANEQINRPKSSDDIEHMELKYEDSASDDDNQEDAKEETVSSSNKAVNYKSQFGFLKRKLKFLIYENEFFQDALRSNQRRLLKVSRDRAFLLDRLLQYEKPENTSTESEETESSEEEAGKDSKRRKLQDSSNTTTTNTSTIENGAIRGRKKKNNLNSTTEQLNLNQTSNLKSEILTNSCFSLGAEIEIKEEPQCHISAAEVERHLQSKQPIIDLLAERTPTTVPTEMFSMDQTLETLNQDKLNF